MEQRLFDYPTEVNCDIMLMVRRHGVVRLISIKSNAWLFTDDMNLGQQDFQTENVYAFEVFMFSGQLTLNMTHDKDGHKLPETLVARKRFNSDKV